MYIACLGPGVANSPSVFKPSMYHINTHCHGIDCEILNVIMYAALSVTNKLLKKRQTNASNGQLRVQMSHCTSI